MTGTSNPITVSLGSGLRFAVSAPAAATVGAAFAFNVTAVDQFNNTATGYAGTEFLMGAECSPFAVTPIHRPSP